MEEAVSLIGDTIVSEFSDLNDLRDLVIVVIRLLVAAILGGLLGLEREQQGKPAGIRTHMLVCMGAALFILRLFRVLCGQAVAGSLCSWPVKALRASSASLRPCG